MEEEGVPALIAANPTEQKAQQVRIEELEHDLERYRATVDAQLAILPAVGESSGEVQSS